MAKTNSHGIARIRRRKLAPVLVSVLVFYAFALQVYGAFAAVSVPPEDNASGEIPDGYRRSRSAAEEAFRA